MSVDPNDYDRCLSQVVGAVRAASSLAAQDVTFYASLDGNLAEQFESSARSLLELANGLLQKSSDAYSPINFGKGSIASAVAWKTVADAIDTTFEKIDLSIDRLKGLSVPREVLTTLEEARDGDVIPAVKYKPQKDFKNQVDNSDATPFKPKISFKPHALLPLEESIISTSGAETDTSAVKAYGHPYEFEIMNHAHPEAGIQKRDPVVPTDWNTTSAIWVDKVESLKEMIEQLSTASEIAVDLEHHDYRTYYGITCLMQISTRSQDWIIDTLALRDDLQSLNEIFANPSIVKVFHGASMDIIWLQRDLGLYIVTLFDTYFATKALGFPRHSLAYLLENFAKFKTSKKYQLADWRVRPLPKVLVDYARADTHFLLYIYDQLRNRLVDNQDKLAEVLFQSRKVAARKFEYISFRGSEKEGPRLLFFENETGLWLMTQYNIPRLRKLLVEVLMNWRDKIARVEDESLRYIMSNQNLVNICMLELPINGQKIVQSCIGQTTMIRSHLTDLTELLSQTLSELVVINEDSGQIPNLYSPSSAVDAEMANGIQAAFIGVDSQQKAFLNENMLRLVKEKSDILPSNDVSGDTPFAIQILDGLTDPRIIMVGEIECRASQLDNSSESSPQEAVPDVTQTLSGDIQEVPLVYEPDPTPMLKADPEQTITLSSKKRNSKGGAVRKRQSEESVVDYASSETKFLEPKQETKKKRKSFDPYSTQPRGIKAVSKRRAVPSGKSASFKSKK